MSSESRALHQSGQTGAQHTRLRVDTETPHYHWLVAGLVLLAEATGTFAGNSVILAVPRLMSAFSADLAAVQWIVAGFLIQRTPHIALVWCTRAQNVSGHMHVVQPLAP